MEVAAFALLVVEATLVAVLTDVGFFLTIILFFDILLLGESNRDFFRVVGCC